MARTSRLREELIRVGIQELNTHGLQGFSVRRISDQLGISVATPYKHFADRDDYIAQIIEHMMARWQEQIPSIIAAYPDDKRQQLVEIATRYIVYLVENAYYRSLIMIKDPELDLQYAGFRHRLTAMSRQLVLSYAESVDMPEDVFTSKLFVVRSFIYGAALMFDHGELEYNKENLAMVRRAIEREFELP